MTTDTTAQSHDQPHDAAEHVRSLFVIYVWLMVLLVLTVVAAFLGERWHFGTVAIVIALAIAVTKASMVVWVFMHVKHGGKLLWVFASAAFVWLVILFAYSLADYASRDVVPKGTLIERHASPAAAPPAVLATDARSP